MDGSPKIGQYMLDTLQSDKVVQTDISLLFEYITDNPKYEGKKPEYKDFKLSKTLKKACLDLLDRYVVLNPEYEPLREEVIFNARLEESIIEALEILTETRNLSTDEIKIKAIKKNFELVRSKLKISEEEILKSGNIFNNLKVAFKKII